MKFSFIFILIVKFHVSQWMPEIRHLFYFWLQCLVYTYHRSTMLFHSHKKRKDNVETRAVLLIFLLELDISGVVVQGIHWDDFDAVSLLSLQCKHFWGNWGDGYRWKRLSQMLVVCYSLHSYDHKIIRTSIRVEIEKIVYFEHHRA